MNSKIILAKGIKLDREYRNVLNISTNDLLNLLTSQDHLVAQADNYSFIKVNSRELDTGFTYNQCLQANYIAIQNPSYSNKWFFGWIDEIEYRSEKNTRIKYTVDSWSTWFNDVTIEPCYIVREHTNNDAIGANTVQENIGFEDVINDNTIIDDSLSNGFDADENRPWVAVLSSYQPAPNKTQFAGMSITTGYVSGYQLLLFDTAGFRDPEVGAAYGFDDLRKYIMQTNADGFVSSIDTIFIIPHALVDTSNITHHTFNIDDTLGGGTGEYYTFNYTYGSKNHEITIPKKTSFSDYTPVNKKLLTYPYNYILLTNNNGGNNVYRYENFSGNNCKFLVQGTISPGCSIRAVPENYKGQILNQDEALALSKYPTCGWSADSYTNWLTQNSVNLDVQKMNLLNQASSAITSPINGAINAASQKTDVGYQQALGGSIINMAQGMVSVAASYLSYQDQFRQAMMLPNINGSQAIGDVLFTSGNNKFIAHQMRAKTEYLRILDDYFTRFGYRTNRIKMPNITGRQNFNYVEIGSADDIGYGVVPSEYMNIINQAARNGVTIWHNYNNLGDYTVSNNII